MRRYRLSPYDGDPRDREDGTRGRTVCGRYLISVLLAVLVTFAGCSGVLDGGDDDTVTFTPAAVPTDDPTSTPVPRLAPGLTRNGITNAGTLAATHDAFLEGTSFTIRQTVTHRTRNGTPVRRVTSVTRVGANGRFRATKRWNGTVPLRRVAYYDDGERLLVATTDADNTTTYRRASSATGESIVAGTGSEQFERVATIAETRVVGRAERNGTTVYRLAPADGQQTRSGTTDLGRSIRLRARVTARGLVRSYTFRQTLSGEGPDGTAVIVAATRYTDIGSTTVERPSWYEPAVAKTNATASNRTGTATAL
jgi:hypothetical protein